MSTVHVQQRSFLGARWTTSAFDRVYDAKDVAAKIGNMIEEAALRPMQSLSDTEARLLAIRSFLI